MSVNYDGKFAIMGEDQSSAEVGNVNAVSFQKKSPTLNKVLEIMLICLLLFLTGSTIFLLVHQNKKNGGEIKVKDSAKALGILNQQQNQLDKLQFVVNRFHDTNYTASNGRSYLLSVTEMVHRTAEIFCRSNNNARLISLGRYDPLIWKDISENMMVLYYRNSIWVGMDDLDAEGTWKYNDGTLGNSNNTFWAVGEPNNYDGREDCAVMMPNLDFKYNDVSCDQRRYVLCESQ